MVNRRRWCWKTKTCRQTSFPARCRGRLGNFSNSLWRTTSNRPRVRWSTGATSPSAQPTTPSRRRYRTATRRRRRPATSWWLYASRHRSVRRRTYDRQLTYGDRWTRSWSGPRQNGNVLLNCIRKFTTPISVNYSVNNRQQLSLDVAFVYWVQPSNYRRVKAGDLYNRGYKLYTTTIYDYTPSITYQPVRICYEALTITQPQTNRCAAVL